MWTRCPGVCNFLATFHETFADLSEGDIKKMRLNTLLKIFGLTAVLALPLTLVGCDDDDDTTTDAATGDASSDTSVGDTTPVIKLDAAPKLDSSTSDAGDASATDAGDASSNG